MSSWLPWRSRGDLCSQPPGRGRDQCGLGTGGCQSLTSTREGPPFSEGPGQAPGGSVWGLTVVSCPPPPLLRFSEEQEPFRDAPQVSASPLLFTHPTGLSLGRPLSSSEALSQHQEQLASRPSVLASSLLLSWLSKNPPDALYPPLLALSLSLLSLSLEG